MPGRPSEDGLADALLRPRSVALIGASDDQAKTAARPLRFLRRAGFAGRVYPVNPRRDRVLGERAWGSLAALPEVPEHVYVLVPTEAVLEALEEAGQRGVRIATVLADGFAEAGPAGRDRERRLREICARTGLRVVGPSSLGVVNLRENLRLTANAAFAESELPEGGIFAASQSGSLIGALVSRGKARGIGFMGLVSVGSESDLGIGEICAATLDNPAVTGYLLFLETIRHADRLREFALGAAARRKPVVAYKLGRSAEAQEIAVSHTGALAGADDVADAFLADCGIARVGSFEALLEALPLLNRVPIRAPGAPKQGVGIVTTTGGGAAMVVEQLAIRGVPVVEPSAGTLRHMAEAGAAVAPGRIVDLTLAGTRYEAMKAALDVLLGAPEFDLVVAVIGSSARFRPELAVRPVLDSAGKAPLTAFLVPEAPEALLKLTEAGVPNFRTPEACADAIAAAFRRRPPKPPVPVPARPASGTWLDELASYELLARIGIPHAPAVALDSKEPEPDLPFAYPVAVKLLSHGIAHKSDVGGVALGIGSRDALVRAVRDIAASVRESGRRLERVLVQPMIAGVGEVLLGYRIDPQVGPIVMLAPGGVLAELADARAIRLAPVDAAEASEMISELKPLRVLKGHRGAPPGDLGALADAVAALSRLAVLPEAGVIEAEINPLIVRERGVCAVDALVQVV